MTWDEAIEDAKRMAADVEIEINNLKRQRRALLNAAQVFALNKKEGLDWGFWEIGSPANEED